MNDLISRQAAINAAAYADYIGLAVEDVTKVTDEVIKELKQIPIADVIEVVYGEWIKMDKRGKNVRCSKCGNTLDLRGVNAGRGDANYCPNCGAKMSTQSNAFSTH